MEKNKNKNTVPSTIGPAVSMTVNALSESPEVKPKVSS